MSRYLRSIVALLLIPSLLAETAGADNIGITFMKRPSPRSLFLEQALSSGDLVSPILPVSPDLKSRKANTLKILAKGQKKRKSSEGRKGRSADVKSLLMPTEEGDKLWITGDSSELEQKVQAPSKAVPASPEIPMLDFDLNAIVTNHDPIEAASQVFFKSDRPQIGNVGLGQIGHFVFMEQNAAGKGVVSSSNYNGGHVLAVRAKKNSKTVLGLGHIDAGTRFSFQDKNTHALNQIQWIMNYLALNRHQLTDLEIILVVGPDWGGIPSAIQARHLRKIAKEAGVRRTVIYHFQDSPVGQEIHFVVTDKGLELWRHAGKSIKKSDVLTHRTLTWGDLKNGNAPTDMERLFERHKEAIWGKDLGQVALIVDMSVKQLERNLRDRQDLIVHYFLRVENDGYGAYFNDLLSKHAIEIAEKDITYIAEIVWKIPLGAAFHFLSRNQWAFDKFRIFPSIGRLPAVSNGPASLTYWMFRTLQKFGVPLSDRTVRLAGHLGLAWEIPFLLTVNMTSALITTQPSMYVVWVFIGAHLALITLCSSTLKEALHNSIGAVAIPLFYWAAPHGLIGYLIKGVVSIVHYKNDVLTIYRNTNYLGSEFPGEPFKNAELDSAEIHEILLSKKSGSEDYKRANELGLRVFENLEEVIGGERGPKIHEILRLLSVWNSSHKLEDAISARQSLLEVVDSSQPSRPVLIQTCSDLAQMLFQREIAPQHSLELAQAVRKLTDHLVASRYEAWILAGDGSLIVLHWLYTDLLLRYKDDPIPHVHMLTTEEYNKLLTRPSGDMRDNVKTNVMNKKVGFIDNVAFHQIQRESIKAFFKSPEFAFQYYSLALYQVATTKDEVSDFHAMLGSGSVSRLLNTLSGFTGVQAISDTPQEIRRMADAHEINRLTLERLSTPEPAKSATSSVRRIVLFMVAAFLIVIIGAALIGMVVYLSWFVRGLLSSVFAHLDHQTASRIALAGVVTALPAEWVEKLLDRLHYRAGTMASQAASVERKINNLYAKSNAALKDVRIVFALLDLKKTIPLESLRKVMRETIQESIQAWGPWMRNHESTRNLSQKRGVIQLGTMWNYMTERSFYLKAARLAVPSGADRFRFMILKLRRLKQYADLTPTRVARMSESEKQEIRQELEPDLSKMQRPVREGHLTEVQFDALIEKVHAAGFLMTDIFACSGIDPRIENAYYRRSFLLSYEESIERALRALQGKPKPGEEIQKEPAVTLLGTTKDVNLITDHKKRFKETRRLANYVLQHPEDENVILENLVWVSNRNPQLLFMRALLVSNYSGALACVRLLPFENQELLKNLYMRNRPSMNKMDGTKRESTRLHEGLAMKKIIVSMILMHHGLQKPLYRQPSAQNHRRASLDILRKAGRRLTAYTYHHAMAIVRNSARRREDVKQILENAFPRVSKVSGRRRQARSS